MLFNSSTFIAFFALLLLLYQYPFPWRTKKIQLLFASYLFYAVWNPPFVLLLFFSTVVDWYASKGIFAAKRSGIKRLLLLVSLSANLGLLGYFKYSNFFLENTQLLLQTVGITYQPAALNIVLPVGISFYTFQTLSYTLDIYLNKARPWHSFLDYALYVTFLPQLVAGPIVRATDFLPQLEEPKTLSGDQLGFGLTLFVFGLFQKVVVADGLLAPIVEAVYGSSAIPSFAAAWAGTLAFAGQIYYDFAGYSNCAIGIAACLGFWLPTNFRAPYAAIGFSDLWTRWHISLSSWLRDYLYIPLGGNRKGASRTYLNLMLTMFIGGLWHGASWTFVIWGGLHGIYLVIERVFKRVYPSFEKSQSLPVKLLLTFSTFIMVCIAWVFFRAQTLSQAFTILSAMLYSNQATPNLVLSEYNLFLAFVTVTFIVLGDIVMREKTIDDLLHVEPRMLRGAMIAALVVAIVLMPGEDRAFIYFQF